MTSSLSPKQTISRWRFWLPLAVQTALILAVPAPAVYTQLTGKTIVLQTAPVDPYDLFRGYYVTLSYDISSLQTLERLPGWEDVAPLTHFQTRPSSLFRPGTAFYLILEAPDQATPEPPVPWQPVRISRDRPTQLNHKQIALQGRYQDGRWVYGLERYYIPEEQRVEINDKIRALQRDREAQPFVVEVKVNHQGQATPHSLWLEKQNYQF
ncbi:MAG: GDYXXLXY domain-containing protein [Cyanothece sp. SIO1E1]|nr:GDYXXLXY domain-containing protein [Cyanothece sp. SIO1E1]